MIVLSVFYKYKKGGFNKRLNRLMQALADHGDIVHFVAVEPYPLNHPNIKEHILSAPFSRSENAFFWAYFLCVAPFYCLWVAWKFRVDVITPFSAFYALICSPASLFLKIRMITFLRADIRRESGFERKSPIRIRLMLLMERIGLRCSSHIVPNSHTLGKAVRKRYGIDPSCILPNHIEKDLSVDEEERRRIRAEYSLAPDAFIIVTAAPLNRVKNIGFLIRAFSNVRMDSAHLLIIGEDLKNTGERKRLERLAADLGIRNRTSFTGWIDTPSHLITSADLFVFPSLQEGSPNALLEALACNIPVIGSRIPEISEILRDDELLFSLTRTAELTNKIRKSIMEPGYYERVLRLSKASKQVYTFDWKERVLEIIQNGKKG